jgi:hypothetical protein
VRVSRKWDEDGIPDQEASHLGELILQVGCDGVLLLPGVMHPPYNPQATRHQLYSSLWHAVSAARC